MLTIDDFARAFGVRPEELPADARDFISRTDFSYEPLAPTERDQTMLGILRKIDGNEFQKVGEHRKEVWEKGWQENLDAFATAGLGGLVPRFVRPNQIVRLNQDYVRPRNPTFELDFFTVFRLWLYQHYFVSASQVFEFGCGSGYNLVALARLFPQKDIYGLDWAESAVKLVNEIGRTQQLRLQGRRFDFFNPDQDLEFGSHSMVLTMAALEQVGSRHEKFLEFLLQKRPALVVHMEPLCELYDPDNLVDYLAIRYHKGRQYLDGYLSRLRALAAEKKIEIVKIQRICFGSLYHEGYSFVVWKPL